MNSIPFSEVEIPDVPEIIEEEIWFDQRRCSDCRKSFRFFIPHINYETRFRMDTGAEVRIAVVRCPICAIPIELSTYRYPERIRKEIDLRIQSMD